MIKILWIVDGVGWGYDNFSKAIAKELPDYEHIMLSQKLMRVVLKDGRNGFIYKRGKSFIEEIDKVNADIVVSMSPVNMQFLKNKDKSIVRFSGLRFLDDWER